MSTTASIAQLPGTDPENLTSSRLWHISFAFDTLDDLLLAYTQRKAHGVLPTWSVNYVPTTSRYYLDPDGNQIETWIDFYDASEGANEFMRSHSYEENRISINVHPEELIEQLKKGADAERLKKRTDNGPKNLNVVPRELVPGGLHL